MYSQINRSEQIISAWLIQFGTGVRDYKSDVWIATQVLSQHSIFFLDHRETHLTSYRQSLATRYDTLWWLNLSINPQLTCMPNLISRSSMSTHSHCFIHTFFPFVVTGNTNCFHIAYQKDANSSFNCSFSCPLVIFKIDWQLHLTLYPASRET